MKIVFDMDGTLANLYAVEGWLDYIHTSNAYPYANAGEIGNLATITEKLIALKEKGITIEIVSWLAKGSDRTYDSKVRYAKTKWLAQHMGCEWSAIHIIKYGKNKDAYRTSTEDILFDDEEQNRKMWGGRAYEPQDIERVLQRLLEN